VLSILELGLGMLIGAGLYLYEVWSNPQQVLEDYLRHIYLLGATGCGKTSKILTDIFLPWILGEVTPGYKPGALVIETKDTESVNDLLNSIPESEHYRVIVFDPYDMYLHGRFIGLNILEKNYSLKTVKTLVGGETISIFQRTWEGYIGPSSEDIIRNITLAAIENEEATILESYRMIKDEEYRNRVSLGIKNLVLKDYFDDFPEPGKNANMFNPPLNKIRAFLTDELALHILAQRNGLAFRQLMDDGKIIIFCLPKGLIGEPLSKLLASIAISKAQLSAFSRSNIPKAERLKKPFLVLADEFQDYCNSSFNTFLEQARSMGICLVIAHQLLKQKGIDESMVDSIMANVGTKYIFACPRDAATMAREMQIHYGEHGKVEPFPAGVLANLPNFQCVAKKIIKGKRTQPKLEKSPMPPPKGNWADKLREQSRELYGVPFDEIQKDLRNRLNIFDPEDYYEDTC
jgi:hypothetical protein